MKIDWDDIEREAKGEIDAAKDFVQENKVADRQANWDRYYGRKLGNEVKGRSSYISRDVMDTIEWMMPYLTRTFAAGDSKIEIEVEGQEAWVGKALMRKIQDDLGYDDENSIFIAFYQWFKDALVSDTAFIKVFWDRDFEKINHTFPQLGGNEMQQLDQDPDVEIISGEQQQITPFETIYTNIKARVKALRKDKLTIGNIPHWEFIISEKAKSINDEYGKGQITEVSIDYLKRINRAFSEDGEEPYFKNLEEIENETKEAADLTQDSEKTNYLGYDESIARLTGETDTGTKATVTLVEWYTRIDVDDDGFLEDVIVWIANGQMIRYEVNKDGFIPFCGLSPILDCYKFFGISYADLLVEIQNLKTQLIRRTLDNYDFQNKGFWIVRPGSKIDVRQLMKAVPGDVIMGDPEAIQNVAPQGADLSSLQMIEYVDTLRENRTGISRYNQGQDATSLNKTATGIGMIQSAAHQRLEQIGRIFAETGLKDFYRKCVLLYQQYTSKPFTAKVKGKEVQVTPEQIQGRIKCRVNMGIEASVGEQEASKIERMKEFIGSVNQEFPGIVGPEQAHNLITRYISSMGFKQPEDYVQDLEKLTQHLQQQMQAQQQAQQQQMQQQQMILQAQMQEKQQGQQIEVAKMQGDQQLKAVDINTKAQTAMEAVGQKERDSQRDHQYNVFSLIAGAENDGSKTSNNRDIRR